MSESIFFGILLVMSAILLLAAGKEELPEGLIDESENTAKFKKPFGKAAVFLWKKARRRKQRRGRGKSESEEAAGFSRQDLIQLQKLLSLLLFGMLAAVLGLLVSAASSQEARIQAGGRIERDSYSGTTKEITASVEMVDTQPQKEGAADGKKDKKEQIVVHVEPRKYTQEETDVLASQAFEKLPLLIVGDNPDLEHVNMPLQLVKSIEGFPFQISWTSADYDLVDTNGKVKKIYAEEYAAAVEENKGVSVDDTESGKVVDTAGTTQITGTPDTSTLSTTTILTAALSYNGWHYRQEYSVTVVPVTETARERLVRRIQEELTNADKEQESDAQLQLPAEIDGQHILWQEEKENTALLIFAIVLAAGIINCLLVDRKLEEQKERRQKNLRMEYPQLISKFVLFLGAGMSVRNVFYKLGQDYIKEKEQGKERKETYEEILLSCRELDSGVSEAVVYGHFGQRCEIRQYTRLATLLVQDLRKGNSELLQVLQEEAQDAIQERRNMARVLGEEAGTKLLMPMIMMLAVTMVIIIIPAFLGFAM